MNKRLSFSRVSATINKEEERGIYETKTDDIVADSDYKEVEETILIEMK